MRWRYPGLAFPVALLALAPIPAFAAHPPVAMQGSWVSDCLPLGKNGRHGLIIRVMVSAGAFNSSGRMFAHNSCDAPVMDFVGQAALGRVKAASGGYDLRLTFMSATMTIRDKSVAALYAQGANCGLATWQVDVPTDVAGRTCEPVSFPSNGSIVTLKAMPSGDRMTIQDLYVLFSAKPVDGVVLPGNVVLRRQ